jgi:hypothetical protein
MLIPVRRYFVGGVCIISDRNTATQKHSQSTKGLFCGLEEDESKHGKQPVVVGLNLGSQLNIRDAMVVNTPARLAMSTSTNCDTGNRMFSL